MSSERSFYIPPEGPPQGILPNPEIYAKMGEANIFRMLEDFYSELSQSTISHLFPEEMREASKKSAAFFVFILGGPPLYQQKYGPPMMRKRHLPFKIDEEARQVWLNTFRKILENADKKYRFPLEHKESFWNYLEKFSSWMVNTR
jgi:hemoglobin